MQSLSEISKPFLRPYWTIEAITYGVSLNFFRTLYYPAITCWDILDGQAGKYIGKDKKWHPGKYLFTVDFAHPESNILDTDHSEIPHEHKCAHIIALDDGNFAAQPNNRCIWDLPSFTVKDNVPDWKVQTNEWNVE